MYSREDRMRAIKLYIKYAKSTALVIRELGYPSRIHSPLGYLSPVMFRKNAHKKVV